MKTLMAIAALALIAPAPVMAQTPVVQAQLIPDDGPPAPSLIACSYNEAGEFTGADSANPGEKAGDPVKTGDGGAAAWRWVVEAKDGTGCPRHIPG
jgi:hypothetical protein